MRVTVQSPDPSRVHLSLERPDTVQLGRVIRSLVERGTDPSNWQESFTRALSDMLGDCVAALQIVPIRDTEVEIERAVDLGAVHDRPQHSPTRNGVWSEPHAGSFDVTVPGAFGMTVVLNSVVVRLVCRPLRPGVRPELRHLRMLDLLYPAFSAAVRDRLGPVHTSLERGAHSSEACPFSPEMRRAMNAVTDGVLCCGRGGKVVWMNASLSRTIEAEPDGEELLAELVQFADAAEQAQVMSLGTAQPEDARYFRSGHGAYRGNALRIGAALDTVLVIVRRTRGFTPTSVAVAAERFSLTPRELEVTRLLVAGHTNDRIAKDLGISPHTVRHHTERVLEKLGVRSRAAIAAVLRAD